MTTIYECQSCHELLTYDGPLPEYRKNHRRQTGDTCEGALWEVCPGCDRAMPNVGPWRDPGSPHTRLCGGCKFNQTFTPERKAKFEKDMSIACTEMCNEHVTVEVKLPSGGT